VNSMYAVEQIEALQHSRIDVGIIRLPANGPGIKFETLFREPLLVVMSANHPFSRRKRIRLSELANQPFVLFPRHLNPPLHDFIIGACHNAGFSPRIVHDAEDLYTRLALVGANFGVTLATASYQQVPAKGIVFRSLQPPVPELEMALAFRSDDKLPLLPLFAGVVKKVFARGGYSAG
jgi:DNA-binding transcriptional LysR family regulator